MKHKAFICHKSDTYLQSNSEVLACLAQVLAAYNIPSVLSPLSL